MNLLDRNNRHTFLKKEDLKSNSFIANINQLVEQLDKLHALTTLSEDQINSLYRIADEDIRVDLHNVAEDLKKGTYNGWRKLDIDFVTNFRNFHRNMEEAERLELWQDMSNRVYYDKISIQFNDGSTISKAFSQMVDNPENLYYELMNWTDLQLKWGSTTINIKPHDDYTSLNVLRIWDASYLGSNINAITLSVATEASCPQYDAYFVGALEMEPIFNWMKTTSALSTAANRINEILNAATYIQQLGDNFVEMVQESLAEVEQQKQIVEGYRDETIELRDQVEEVYNRYQELNVTRTVAPVGTVPDVNYSPLTNNLNFILPESEVAVIGLSNFAIDVANGHLSMDIRNEEDVEKVYINEEGNVIIQMKKVEPEVPEIPEEPDTTEPEVPNPEETPEEVLPETGEST